MIKSLCAGKLVLDWPHFSWVYPSFLAATPSAMAHHSKQLIWKVMRSGNFIARFCIY